MHGSKTTITKKKRCVDLCLGNKLLTLVDGDFVSGLAFGRSTSLSTVPRELSCVLRTCKYWLKGKTTGYVPWVGPEVDDPYYELLYLCSEDPPSFSLSLSGMAA